MNTRPLLYVNKQKDIPLTPWMDDEGFTFYKKCIANSNCYLEYGCGGSTIYTEKNSRVESIISVDSDETWVLAIKNKLRFSNKRLFIEYCNIGETGDWGVPKNNSHFKNYWNYMTTPWECARKESLNPDLILIDGRFRVASFLYSIVCSELNTTILFDDYTNRPEYHVCEEFCKLKETAGRMAIFTKINSYSFPQICQAIAKYSVVEH